MSELEKTGVFLVSYRITTSLVGAPTLNLNLMVNTPKETVHGLGKITQSTNPPLDITTKLDGHFTYMTVMPDNTHILVTAIGYPVIHWPSHGGPGPVILPNFKLWMVLSKDWKSGTANYKYTDSEGNWQSINEVEVKLTDSPVLA